jgi:hypothetical protein
MMRPCCLPLVRAGLAVATPGVVQAGGRTLGARIGPDQRTRDRLVWGPYCLAPHQTGNVPLHFLDIFQPILFSSPNFPLAESITH